MIEAIIFDIGGVFWRAGAMRLSDKWADRCGLSADAFDDIVFRNPLGMEAMVGKIHDDDFWAAVGSTLGLDADETREMEADIWKRLLG